MSNLFLIFISIIIFTITLINCEAGDEVVIIVSGILCLIGFIMGIVGIVLNKNFSHIMSLNDVVPELASLPPIPLYKGGPIGRDTLFYLHTFDDLKDALPLGNGLYMNGDFDQMKQYLLSGAPTQGLVRFFMGYAGWQKGQLRQEIESNTWIINNDSHVDLLHMYLRDLWKETLCEMGGKYAVWSRYPKYPIMN